jgi:hypothetical protein
MAENSGVGQKVDVNQRAFGLGAEIICIGCGSVLSIEIVSSPGVTVRRHEKSKCVYSECRFLFRAQMIQGTLLPQRESKPAPASETAALPEPVQAAGDGHVMTRRWWQETAEELAAKVRGYFTNAGGKVKIAENLDGDSDLYRLASRLTTRIVQPGGRTKQQGRG